MAPLKNKRKNGIATRSTSKLVDSDEKPLQKGRKKNVNADESTSELVGVDSDKKPIKKGRKNGNYDESILEEIYSNNKIIEEEKGGDAKESVQAPKVKKPCTWLKLDRLDPQFGNKSLLQSCKQEKESKSVPQVQAKDDNKRKRTNECEEKDNNNSVRDQKHNGRRLQDKEKGFVSNKHEETTKDNTRERTKEGEVTGSYNGNKEKEIVNNEERTKEDDKSGLGGLIFMCNAKTKPDCFRYQVMGIPINKKEVVMNIKPGLTLFLYDYDLKLMYGIFEASSAGGIKLEPAAFGGGFPAQVRFSVQKDCIPLPESMFKKAIKDSYDERTHKFKTELTVNQVKNLIDMFRPAPWLHANGKSNVREADSMIHPHTIFPGEEPLKGQRYLNNHGISNKRDPLFVTEQEYRNHGLRMHLSGGDVSNTRVPKLDQELKQLIRDPAVHQKEVNPNPLFLSEKDYRAYGLRAHQQIPNVASPMMTTNEIGNVSYDPYDESTNSLVNKYLALPRAMSTPAETYLNQTSEMQNHSRRMVPDGERAFTSYSLGEQSDLSLEQYSLHASREPSEINQGFSVEREGSIAPVSQRYSFGGPSPYQHR